MKQNKTLNCRALRRGVAALLLLTVSVAANAYDFSDVNYDGVIIYYNILSSSDKTCEVTYKDTKYDSYSGIVVIPETVTGYSGMSRITYTVTAIGTSAFRNCTGLTEITIPNSVTEIGGCAFMYCSGLAELTIPENVTTIGSNAFDQCYGLMKVTIPENVTTIGSYAFWGLRQVNFDAIACTSVSSHPFSSGVNISTFNFGDKVTIIPGYLCEGLTGLTEVTIPESVTSIGSWAFSGCTGLTSVTIPDSVTSIGNYAFNGCSGLTSVTIGESVTEIGNWAFEYCSGLTSVTIGESVTTIGNGAFDGCSGLTSLTIGNGVTEIGNWAFDGCRVMTSITIPENVTLIGYGAFRDCTRLTSIYTLNPEPPTCNKSGSYDAFYNVNKSTCTLYVPEGSLEAYSTANQWQDFLNIVEFDVTPVSSITAEGNAVEVGYYTTDGKQVPTLQKGVNIIRYSDGTAKKVLVK